jgi:hypothetical protein
LKGDRMERVSGVTGTADQVHRFMEYMRCNTDCGDWDKESYGLLEGAVGLLAHQIFQDAWRKGWEVGYEAGKKVERPS